MHKAIQAFLADLLPVCSKAGLQLCSEKEIAYGIQLEFENGKDKILLNVYYSEKKGISSIINSSKNHVLKAKLENCLGVQTKPEIIAMHSWNTWIGSDECGKGDFFGPLIVCGFLMDIKAKETLLKLGVCDSKKLRKEQILDIAKGLYQTFPANIECLILKPQKYNELYASFSAQRIPKF
jgi:ribonuclease HIII